MAVQSIEDLDLRKRSVTWPTSTGKDSTVTHIVLFDEGATGWDWPQFPQRLQDFIEGHPWHPGHSVKVKDGWTTFTKTLVIAPSNIALVRLKLANQIHITGQWSRWDRFLMYFGLKPKPWPSVTVRID